MVEGPPKIERMIAHYRLIKVMGEGKFGTGWMSEDTEKDQIVCVKLFKGLDESVEASFNTELEAG